jgi:6-phosphofructokinase 1
MAGKTKLLIGYWNYNFVHVPITTSSKQRKQVDPSGKLWQGVLDATGQKDMIGAKP